MVSGNLNPEDFYYNCQASFVQIIKFCKFDRLINFCFRSTFVKRGDEYITTSESLELNPPRGSR